MTRPSRALPALAGAAALTFGVVSPAAAAEFSAADPTGDVVSFSYDEETDTESGPDPEPGNTTADVTGFSAAHMKRRVELATSIRDITAGSGYLYYLVRTNERSYYAIQRLGTERVVPKFELVRRSGRPVRCGDARHSVDRTADEARLSIPRTCLGGPNWVRVGAGAVDFQGRDFEKFFIDDALMEGATGDDVTLTPRLQRN